jgi:hypothetical protein
VIVLYIENALSAGMFTVTKKRAPEQILHLHVYYIYTSIHNTGSIIRASRPPPAAAVEKFIEDYLEKIRDDARITSYFFAYKN